MGNHPSYFKGANRPVEEVSWMDVTSFCDKLTDLERTAGACLLEWLTNYLPRLIFAHISKCPDARFLEAKVFGNRK
jgi:hypothetical protein